MRLHPCMHVARVFQLCPRHIPTSSVRRSLGARQMVGRVKRGEWGSEKGPKEGEGVKK